MPVPLPDLPQTEAAVIEMTNAFRGENHLATVAPNAALRMAAQAFAEYLAKSGAFGHTVDGRQPSDRARAAGYRYCIVAENLALNQSSRGFETKQLAASAIECWKNSPLHRAAMLQPHVTEIGLGIAKASDADPKYLLVQMFGRPETFKYGIDIENRSGGAVAYSLGDKKGSIAPSTRVKHTACVPHELTFETGKVTSKFEARDGATFVLTRGADGALRIDLAQTAARARPAAKPQR